MYPAIEFCKLDGNEKIIASDGSKISSVVEFWRWAYSDIMGNAERGVFAEYLVACALGVQDSVRISWDKYDLKTKEYEKTDLPEINNDVVCSYLYSGYLFIISVDGTILKLKVN